MVSQSTRHIRFVLFTLSVIAGLMAFSKSFANGSGFKMQDGQNSHISDGDTIRLRLYNSDHSFSNDTPISIRFLHIDAPEMHVKDDAGKWHGQGHWGSDAKIGLEEMMPLYSDITIQNQGLDKYGRTLAVLYFNNLNINLEMVKRGYAFPYIVCGKGECSESYFKTQKIDTYLKACEDARDKELGIWDSHDPVPEYPFEFRLKVQNRSPDKYVGDFYTGALYQPQDYNKVDICHAVFFYDIKDAIKLGFTLR